MNERTEVKPRAATRTSPARPTVTHSQRGAGLGRVLDCTVAAGAPAGLAGLSGWPRSKSRLASRTVW